MKRLFSKFFPGKQSGDESKKSDEAPSADPLDPFARKGGWTAEAPSPIQLSVSDFPIYSGRAQVGDSIDGIADSEPSSSAKRPLSSYAVPVQLQGWYSSQSFIGHQLCAIIAQHWLVDKACSMAGEDAVRNGWEIKARGDGEGLKKSDYDRLRSYDIPYRLKANMTEFERFKNIFGVRVAIFVVESDDNEYYEKPFNPDGVTKGSYKGISQVDPYWMMPTMTSSSTSDPSDMHFYEPEYWTIGSQKYHRSHLIIARGPMPADILKPTYLFGGVPMTQRIYERVYAAERTANEAPLLALNKRTTAIHVDVAKAAANQKQFEEKLLFWIKYRDNHAVKVLGKDETMEQFDTSLTDFDSVIMNQYQLVAAISEVPATKLLGTSPKGFSATGEFETVSYHEHLESIQEHSMAPMAERHYILLARSLGIDVDLQVIFDPVDSVTAQQRADLNEKIAGTNEKNINMGAVSPEEVRRRLRDDKHSGYSSLSDEDAEEEPGMSPENLAALQKSGSEQEQGQAALQNAGSKPGATTPPISGPSDPTKPSASVAPDTPDEAPLVGSAGTTAQQGNAAIESMVKQLLTRLQAVEEHFIPEGQDIEFDVSGRTVKPSVRGIKHPAVAGINSVFAHTDATKMPKMKVGGLVISIENPRGTVRKGMDIDGNPWSAKMPHHYGFIRGVIGADGDEVDCFIGPNLKSEQVFVVNQKDSTTGDFDEHKCMLGFDTIGDATEAYLAAYSADWDGLESVVPMPLHQFKTWLQTEGGCKDRLMQDAMDEASFKEIDHPRAKNGQFGSGGGGGAAGSSAPSGGSGAAGGPAKKPGSKKDALPALAKSMTEKSGKAPTPAEFHEAALAQGFEIIPEQSVKYLKMYLKEQKSPEGKKESPAKVETKIEVKKEHKKTSHELAKSLGFESPTSAVEKLAPDAGYKSEGIYNGINYFKSAAGDKVSYKADSDSWAFISGGKLVTQNSGLESLQSFLKNNKAAPPKPGTMAAAPVSVSHSTSTAKAYGDAIPEDKFSFSSKGIANEKALPEKVQSAILAYKGNDYHAINGAMRFNSSFDPDSVSPQTMAHILNLQRAFSAVAPSKKDVILGRKIKLEALKTMAKDAGISDLNDLKPGMVLREPGIMSTSHDAHVWNGDIRFEINVPKGTKAIDISETIKKNQKENEVLLAPESKLKISSVKKDHEGFKYHITCDLV